VSLRCSQPYREGPEGYPTPARWRLRHPGRRRAIHYNIDPASMQKVVFGCVGQIGTDAYVVRAWVVNAGPSCWSTALTVNRLCGSGLQAINKRQSLSGRTRFVSQLRVALSP